VVASRSSGRAEEAATIELIIFGINPRQQSGNADGLVAAVRRRRPRNPPTSSTADWPQLHRSARRICGGGFDQIRDPRPPSRHIDDFIDRFVAELGPRQN